MTPKQRPNDPKVRGVRDGKRSRSIFAHAIFLGVGMLLMAGIFLVISPQNRASRNSTAADSSSSDFRPVSRAGLPQPFGKVEVLPLSLGRPEIYFNTLRPLPATTRWVLSNAAPAQLSELLDSLDLSGAARSFLADSSHWEKQPDGFELIAPPEVVLDFQPRSRQRFYSMLGQLPANAAQRNPYRLPVNAMTDLAMHSGLSSDKIDLFRKLSYTNEETICFADATAFAQLSTPEETALLIKALSRVPTFILKLEIDPDAKLDAVLNYWAKFSGKDTRLFLQSLARASDSGINVSFFLPSFARLRIYTYPPVEEPRAAEQDDVWTAMNFYNKTPDDRFLDHAYAEKVLRTNYVRLATKERQFGDLIAFVSHEQLRRMCVYVADDFVFTKRGPGLFEPWLLMEMKELIAESLPDRPFEVHVYRPGNHTAPVAGSE